MTQKHKHLIVRADIGWCPKEEDLNKISDEISNIKKDFWIKDGCKIKIKLIIHDSEAVIDMPDEFSFTPNLENLNFLTDIFGVNSIEI